MINSANARAIHTGLYSAKAKEVMDSVFGQLSDGWGENNPRNDKWWKFGKVEEAPDGEILIYISNAPSERDYRGKYIYNGFVGMDAGTIKSWMARMVKKTMVMELKDHNCAEGWNRKNENFKTCYLGNGRDTSVAEVYCIYEMLLGREVGLAKYEAHTICAAIGLRRTPDMVEIEMRRRGRIEELSSANDAKIASLNQEEKNRLDALNAEIARVKEEFRKKRQETYSAFRKQCADEGLVSKQ